MHREKPAEKEDEARKPTSSIQGRFFRRLVVVFLIIVFGIPIALALGFVVLGFGSVGYYGPPIGDVLSFLQNAVIVSAAAATPLIALLAFLYQIPRCRRYIDRLLDRILGEEQLQSDARRREAETMEPPA